jgi:hypothetical protein
MERDGGEKMKSRWKGLIVVALICALTATLLWSTVVYSAPPIRPIEGPLAWFQGEVDFGTGAVFQYDFRVAGFRQVSIYISPSASVAAGAITVEVYSVLTTSATPYEVRERIGVFDATGGRGMGTYQIQSDIIRVRVYYDGTLGNALRLSWYLTE